MYHHKNGVVLTKISTDQACLLADLKGSTWWGTHRFTFTNIEEQMKWIIDSNKAGNCVFLANLGEEELKMNAKAVGIISNIDSVSRTADISGSVFPDHINKKIGKKCFEAGVDFAFEMFNLHRLNAEILETNIGAYKIDVEHLGFKVEGIKRKSVWKCGTYYNSLILGLLREEWENSTRIKDMQGICNKVINLDQYTMFKDYVKVKVKNEVSNFNDLL